MGTVALAVNILVSSLFALIRVSGHGTGNDLASKCYKDAAHFYVCGLFVSWYYTRDQATLILAVTLSLIELTCAIISGIRKRKANKGTIYHGLQKPG